MPSYRNYPLASALRIALFCLGILTVNKNITKLSPLVKYKAKTNKASLCQDLLAIHGKSGTAHAIDSQPSQSRIEGDQGATPLRIGRVISGSLLLVTRTCLPVMALRLCSMNRDSSPPSAWSMTLPSQLLTCSVSSLRMSPPTQLWSMLSPPASAMLTTTMPASLPFFSKIPFSPHPNSLARM